MSILTVHEALKVSMLGSLMADVEGNAKLGFLRLSRIPPPTRLP